jgi:hypothetical protein
MLHGHLREGMGMYQILVEANYERSRWCLERCSFAVGVSAALGLVLCIAIFTLGVAIGTN